MKKYKIADFKMYLDPKDHGISRELIRKGAREHGFMWILKNEVDGIALDVGANIGYCTLFMASRCERVWAFEPDHRSFKLLKKNIELNKCSNVITWENAISDTVGIKTIYIARKPNLTTMCSGQKDIIIEKDMSCTTIDIDFQKGNHLPNFIKADIEGAEVALLKGAHQTLKDAQKMKLLFEVHPQHYGPDNDFAEQLHWLRSVGYAFKYVVNAKGYMKKVSKSFGEPLKRWKNYQRAVFGVLDQDKALQWLSHPCKGRKKKLRAFMMEKV